MTFRPSRFRVGAMRERINVQSLTETVSDAGDVTRTWATTYLNEPATFEEVQGGETLRGRQVEAGVTAVFIVHWRDSYNETMRVVYSGDTYGIVKCPTVEGGRRYRELWCKRG